jgi:hypothetical protein
MKIVVDEKEFNRIIQEEAIKYEYAHYFMHPDETPKDFKETKRWHMMKTMQHSIKNIEDRLKAA